MGVENKSQAIQGVFTPAGDDKYDTKEVVDIEKETFAVGDLDGKSGGVVIGQGVLKNAANADGSVIIGIDNIYDELYEY